MGSYTTIIARDLGELQIKCGYDVCQIYSFGQLVDQRIDPDRPNEGYLLDGAYEAWRTRGEGPGPHDFVIIKDGRVHDTVSYNDILVRSGSVNCNPYTFLEQHYGLMPPDPKLWSEAAWEAKRAREAAWAQEQAEFQASFGHLSPKEQMLKRVTWNFRRQLNYTSIGRKTFLVEPLPTEDDQ
jgi:hypothetical protein